MFTGIIETIGTVTHLQKAGGNLHFIIQSSISSQLKIDQSLSHNGVCLTVVGVENDQHTVVAVEETLFRSNIGFLEKGSKVNIERAMPANGRFDGHIVQGHVDQTGKCVSIVQQDGSWIFTFDYDPRFANLLAPRNYNHS